MKLSLPAALLACVCALVALGCEGDVPPVAFAVRPPDPHSFDGNGDGVGCETG